MRQTGTNRQAEVLVLRLFDAYIVVDWSAASARKTGANSIWIGIRSKEFGIVHSTRSLNLATRFEACTALLEITERLIALGEKVLIGFDFALGYPSGTANALGLFDDTEAAWSRTHSFLSEAVKDRANNSNNRFELAASLNRRMTGRSHPFWGAPKSKITRTLSHLKGNFLAEPALPEFRRTELWVGKKFDASPKSVWQLLGAGAVGSQSLLGIPVVNDLRKTLPNSRVWPFETGFRDLRMPCLTDVRCVLAEVYPSTISVHPGPAETRDEAQVRALSEHLESLDSAGELSAAFGPPKGLSTREIDEIICEEGWILAK